ncbi:capsular polysaccharide export protein, LipB/KpsS family [Methylorubrum aminovorans]
MKNILFYTESFPIRNNPFALSWVFRLFCGLIRNDLVGSNYFKNFGMDVRVMAPHIDEPALKDLPGLSAAGKILRPTEGDYFNRLRLKYADLPWIPDGFLTWKDLIRGEGEVTDEYMKALIEVHASYPFDVLIYWGNNGAIRRFSKLFSIPAIALELGCMRPPFANTYYCDFNGVNGYSSLSNISLPEPTRDYPLPALNDSLKRGWDQLLWPSTLEKTEKPTVLVPLQLMDDSNIGVFSEFTSMSEFVLRVHADLKPLGARMIVKPHPGAKDYTWTRRDHADCEQLCASLPDTKWLTTFDNNVSYLSLLQMISGAVTVNSSTGFEASIFGKPVLSYGSGAYDALCYRDPASFIEAIRNSNFQDKAKARNRALSLLYHYLCDASTVRDAQRFIYQIRRQLDVRAASLHSREEFLKTITNSNSFTEVSSSVWGSGLTAMEWA